VLNESQIGLPEEGTFGNPMITDENSLMVNPIEIEDQESKEDPLILPKQ
jgi:hypothetical protein